jgi:hypothetical protein
MSVGYTSGNTSRSTVFIVRNISNNNQCIHIFNVPINCGQEYDLMKISYISEIDIKNSLLKGELYTKISQNQIIVVESNITLIQFDDVQKEFLQSAGISIGIVGASADSSTPSDEYTEEEIANIIDEQILQIPDATLSSKGLATAEYISKINTLPTSTNYSGTVASGETQSILSTISISASSNVFIEIDFNIHGYNGILSSGYFQAIYQRIGSATATELSKSLVGSLANFPVLNPIKLVLELSGNNILIKIIPDTNNPINYKVTVISSLASTV